MSDATPVKEESKAVHYLLFDGMTFQKRLALSLGLVLLSLALQFLVLWNLGALVMIAGVVMLAPRGIGNSITGMAYKGEWKEVTLEEFQRARNLSKSCGEWGANWLEIYCGKGALAFVLLIVVLVVLLFAGGLAARIGFFDLLLSGNASAAPEMALFLDLILIALPLWFLGGITRETRSDLVLRIEALLTVVERLKAYPVEGWRLKFMFEMAKAEKGEVPSDARLSLSPEEGPPDFLGLQIQLSMNDVQGRKYPYLYAVAVAKKGFGLHQVEAPESRKDVFEPEEAEEVDVMVIRQITTKTSGYHTTKKDMVRVFEAALAFAQSAVEAHRQA